ncbi:MAG TPA: hypothetical protein VMW73_01985, partial [Spirochaetia bacterium]|nr:hypothetical protein [Spirochaetia bacterium]
MRRRRTRRAWSDNYRRTGRSYRSSRPTRTYSIAYLLSRQPVSLRKQDGYDAMMRYYHASERLQQVRFGRRCYSLLQNARIEPQNLTFFYRTYRLPDDPFFASFFRIKRNYLAEREGVKEARRQYILQAMRALQPAVLANIKYLGYLERYYNGAGRSPVWQQHLFPGSRKKADSYARLSNAAWLALFR